MGKFWKWLLAIAGALLLLFVGAQAFLYFYFDDVLRNILQQAVSKASEEKYRIKIGHIGYDFFTRSFTASGVELQPDTALIHAMRLKGDSISQIYYIHIPKLHMDGIQVMKAWRKEELRAGSLYIADPDIKIVRNNRWADHDADDKAQGFNLNDMVPAPYKGIYMEALLVNDAQLELLDENNRDRQPMNIHHVSVQLKDLAIERQERKQHKKLYYAGSLDLLVRNYELMLPDSVHRLTIDQVHFDGHNLTVQELKISPDSAKLKKAQRPLGLNRIHVPEIRIDSINIFRAFSQNDIQIKKIMVKEPVLALGKPSQGEKGARVSGFNPFLFLPDAYRSLKIGIMEMKGGSVSFYTDNKPDTRKMLLNPILVQVINFSIDTATSREDKRVLYSDDVRIKLNGFSRLLPDHINKLTTGNISLSSAEQSLYIAGIQVQPVYSKAALGKLKKKETDWISLKTGRLALEGLNIHDLLEDQQLVASKVLINQLNVYAYRDKRLPDDTQKRVPMPQEMLRQADYLMSFGQVNIRHAHFTYEEFAEKAKQAGSVSFTDINLDIHNLTTSPGAGTSLTVNGTGQINGQGKVSVHLTMPLKNKDDNFTLSGSIDEMPFQTFNDMIASMGIRIKDGYIGRMLFDIQGNKDVAVGSMSLYYKGLKIAITDKETGQANGFKETLGSFVANNLVIESDNPKKNQPLRIGSIHFARLQNKAFTNYMWNSVLSGIKSSIGVAEVADRQQEKKEKKEDRKEKRQERKEKKQGKKAQKKARMDGSEQADTSAQ